MSVCNSRIRVVGGCMPSILLCYNYSIMGYQVVPGTYVDLAYLNKQLVSAVKKKGSFQETAHTLLEVGTSYIFNQGKASRRIPVVFST